MATMAEVVHQFGGTYLEKFSANTDQIKLIHNIRACKTQLLGSHLTACTQCGNVKVHYNSCGNRGCPGCQGVKKEKWILERSHDLLPVKHFHVVFTLPSQLRDICLQNKKLVYNLIFKCAWKTLEAFSKDPKQKLQANMGMTCVLHSWTQTLVYHPHIHCIVPAGGITADGKWKATKSDGRFLFPVKAMASVFKGKFMEQLIRYYKSGDLDLNGRLATLQDSGAFWELKRCLYEKQWIVYAKDPFGNPASVLEYLARYTHRIAISNYRILTVDEENVTFSYLDRKSNRKRTLTLPGVQFLARFLLHVLPAGYCKIRHYGIFATRVKSTQLRKARASLGVMEKEKVKYTVRDVVLITTGVDIHLCSECKTGLLMVIEETPRPRGSPSKSIAC
jgi:hypothetical protein